MVPVNVIKDYVFVSIHVQGCKKSVAFLYIAVMFQCSILQPDMENEKKSAVYIDKLFSVLFM